MPDTGADESPVGPEFADPIAELQARVIIDQGETIASLEEQTKELQVELNRMRALVTVYQNSRAVRLSTMLRTAHEGLLRRVVHRR